MPAEGKAPRLAVLIDAENASARIAEALFTEIATTLGEASARRIYGDFASPQVAGWTRVLARYAIQPQQNFANTKGKNSGDIALEVAFAPRECRTQAMRGLAVIAFADGPGAPRLALGESSWRWSDLLGAR